MEKDLYDEMFRMEHLHWWFVGKRQITLSLLRRYLPPLTPGKHAHGILDLGCGCGMMLSDLKNEGYEAIGIDSSDEALDYCARRGARAMKGILPDDVPLPANSMDAALLLDVLEHMWDDVAVLNTALGLVRKGGLVIATVPAYSWLWTKRDDLHHHKRRYDRSSFSALLGSLSDSEVVLKSYMNSILFPIVLIQRLTNRLVRKNKNNLDLTIPPLGLNNFMKKVFAAERVFFTHGLVLPFGLSLLLVIRKK